MFILLIYKYNFNIYSYNSIKNLMVTLTETFTNYYNCNSKINPYNNYNVNL